PRNQLHEGNPPYEGGLAWRESRAADDWPDQPVAAGAAYLCAACTHYSSQMQVFLAKIAGVVCMTWVNECYGDFTPTIASSGSPNRLQSRYLRIRRVMHAGRTG